MRKPELRITEKLEGVSTKGICSSCPDITFTIDVIGSQADNQEALELLFAAHFNQVHLREDVPQFPVQGC